LKNKIVSTCWLTGNSSTTLVLPKEWAKKLGLDKPCQLLLELKNDTIIVKKINWRNI